ncbi:MAG: glycosyltransferase [Bdellovibrionales bacterium]
MSDTRKKIILVVPCYNEEERLDKDQFLNSLTKNDELQWLFVNDGSSDNTSGVIKDLAKKKPDRMYNLDLDQNMGKGEAVRQGLLKALDMNADITGYFDADLATPIPEMLRLIDLTNTTEAKVILGSRAYLLGHDIQRTKMRFFLGRVFAFVAGILLGIRINDTQCGAKVLVNHEGLRHSLKNIFISRWLFDIELIHRIYHHSEAKLSYFYEEPLRKWTDVAGSKIKPSFFLFAIFDLLKIKASLKTR